MYAREIQSIRLDTNCQMNGLSKNIEN